MRPWVARCRGTGQDCMTRPAALWAPAMRTATISRKTARRAIDVTVNLDGTGAYAVSTGIGFLDHMLEQLSRHSLIDIDVKTVGRPAHRPAPHRRGHRRSRSAQAIAKALGDKRGIRRYGDALCADGRDADPRRARHFGPAVPGVEDRVLARSGSARWTPRLFEHWFHCSRRPPGSRCTSRRCTASNNHHIAESAFKGLRAGAARSGRDRSAQGRRDARHQGDAVAGRADRPSR